MLAWVLLSPAAPGMGRDVCQQPPGDEWSSSSSAAGTQPWKLLHKQVWSIQYILSEFSLEINPNNRDRQIEGECEAPSY